ncbi:DMT family transporter [Thermotoga sp.]|uniref:DMT family transporter n=1 Tax=Thermotoga sp. TaxID=28240 RepID=UPI0025EC89AA|nr:DMT family transporter [Thermotoga sp.]MCD6551590.1 DMT family transporter [Thermotoga sp.]
MWRESKALIFLLLTAALQGSTFPLQKLVVGGVSPFAYNAVRFGSAALISLWIFGPGRFKRSSLLGLVLCGAYIFQMWGLKFTSAARSGFIVSSFVFFVPIFSFLLEGERLRKIHLFSFALGFLGIYLLTGGIKGFSLGDLFQLFCAVLFALHVVLITKFSKVEREKDMLFWQFLTVAVVNLAFGTSSLHLPLNALIVGLYSGLFATVLGIFWQMRYQKEVGSNTTALVYMTQPFISLVLSVSALGERMTVPQFAGGLITALALFVGTRVREKKST